MPLDSAMESASTRAMMSGVVAMVAVGAGGAVGAVLRHEVARRVTVRLGHGTFGIFAVNFTGSFLIGMMAGWLLPAGGATSSAGVPWLLLVTGVLGSYTTVSSFSLQTLTLLREGKAGAAILNIAATIVLCISATAAGFALMMGLA